MIECRNLVKRFDDLKAIDRLNLNIGSGQIYGIIGPNGAGKTTLMRMLSGAILPDEGEFFIDGLHGVKKIDQIRNKIGYMPQVFSLYGDLTVEENMKFFARLYGTSQKEFNQREEGLLAFTRLKPFKDRLASKLSGGMYKKLALICNMIYQPQVFLLDEPTIGVDPISRRELWDILNELPQKGATVVLTTSYMEEAERCGRVCLLHRGTIAVEGRGREIKENLPVRALSFHAGRGRAVLKQLESIPGFFLLNELGGEIRVLYEKSSRYRLEVERMLGLAIPEIEPSFEEVFAYYEHNSGSIR